MEPIDFGKDAANPSGAPEAGGATSRGSRFGGDSLTAKLLRMLARVARAVEASAYRRLRDLERELQQRDQTIQRPGAPRRVREAAQPHPPAHEPRIH